MSERMHILKINISSNGVNHINELAVGGHVFAGVSGEANLREFIGQGFGHLIHIGSIFGRFPSEETTSTLAVFLECHLVQ